MPEDIRGQIFDLVEQRLQTIQLGAVLTLETGEQYTCQSNIGSAVWSWREAAFDPRIENYAVYLSDPEQEDRYEGVPVSKVRHILRIDAVVELAASLPVDTLRKMIADIRACVGVDPKWSGLARWSQIEEDSIEKVEAAHTLAGARVRISIEYDTNRWRT